MPASPGLRSWEVAAFCIEHHAGRPALPSVMDVLIVPVQASDFRETEMEIEVRQDSVTNLAEYANIPIAFEVNSVLDIAETFDSEPRFELTERSVSPYIKDYDAIDGEHPTQWPGRFDVPNWVVLVAWAEGRRIGGAVIAFDTAGLEMFEGRRDLAVVWDIRVSPEFRGQGVGSSLFQAAEDCARERGCRQIKVETQNINVPACDFYARMGCVLESVQSLAYPGLPDEVQLLWYKDLSIGTPASR
jgi:GNAT superfamily N-acetyltransferase